MDLLKNNFNKIIELAKNEQAQVELLYKESENLNLSFKKKQLEKFESIQSQMAGLRVIYKNTQGYAYTENLSEESLLQTYQEALLNAKNMSDYAKDDQTNTLLLHNLDVSIQKQSPHLAKEKVEDIDLKDKKNLAQQLEENCYKISSFIQSVPWVGFSESTNQTRIMNSHGLDRQNCTQSYMAYAYPLAKDHESTKMGGESVFTRNFHSIDIDQITQLATQKAVEKLNAKPLKTNHYATIIHRDEFPMILQMIESYFSAKDVFENKSLWSKKLNQLVASEFFNLSDNPLDFNFSGFRPFDSEGYDTQITSLIENGVLKNFITNSEYAIKMKLPHTKSAARSPVGAMGIGCSTLFVQPGQQSLQNFLNQQKGPVVFITEFAGGLHAGFKSSTGDFSLPAEGLLYDNGQLVGPVDQFVVSGNINDLLMKITGLGQQLNNGASGYVAPDVYIESLSYAGA